MAKLIDPDDLSQGTEVTFNTTLKTIALNQAGNLSTDGVTLQCLYSFCKEEWKNDGRKSAGKLPGRKGTLRGSEPC